MMLSVVIPAYNEERTIGALIDRVLALDLSPDSKEVIVVNDGSKDGTDDVLKKYASKVTVLTHPKNRGKGAAVRTGFEKASGDYVVVQDADLEYDPQDLRRMLHAAAVQKAPVMYGSRRLPMNGKKNKSARWYYFFGGTVLTLITNLLYGTHITDEPTCYKMVHKDVLKRIALVADGFEFCPEITAKIARLGIPIHEIPITYAPRNVTEGKKIRAKDGLIAIWTLVKNRL
jgi:glycosyltransferase involved in cell wall biosynthesis